MRGLALCCGIGGLELGIRLACDEYRTVAYVEKDAYCQKIIRARIADGWLEDGPIYDDVARFPAEDLRGRADIISAGFPCQPWSLAGKQRGIDDERWLWPIIAETIRVVEPRYVFLENVPGLVTGGGINFVLGNLAELGFDAEWGAFRASDVGAPHRRERIFILAHTVGIHRPGRRTDVNVVGTPGDPEGEAYERQWLRNAPDDSGAYFPPNRFDADAWRAALERQPELAPATEPGVRGLAHGNAKRVDQLRAYGNAVVPVVAALAFQTLWGRLSA